VRAAQGVWAALQPHSKEPLDPNDYRLFPEDALDLPEDVEGQERDWMLKLDRKAG
jgi:hypothetical protein